MIQTLKLGRRIMRYELADFKWAGIKVDAAEQAAKRPAGK